MKSSQGNFSEDLEISPILYQFSPENSWVSKILVQSDLNLNSEKKMKIHKLKFDLEHSSNCLKLESNKLNCLNENLKGEIQKVT